MDKKSLIETIVDMSLERFISEKERGSAKESIAAVIPEPFGVSADGSMAIALTKTKTAALFFDRVWCCLPNAGKEDWCFFGGTYYEIVNAVFLYLKDGVRQIYSAHPDQRSMLVTLQAAHELFLATGDFLNPDPLKAVPLFTPATRSLAESIEKSTGIGVATVYDSQAECDKEYTAGDSAVIVSCLSDIKIVDEDALSWEQVDEFRKDDEARRKYRKFVHWLDKEMAGKPLTYMETEIANRLEGYEWALRKHGISTVLGTLSGILESKAVLAGLASALIGPWIDQTIAGLTAGLGLASAKCVIEIAKISLEKEDIKRSNAEVAFVYELKSLMNR